MRKNPKKILVVANETGVRTALRKNLSAKGFKVTESTDGPSSIALAKRQKPDLIVLDLIMAGQSGIDTYHALRADPVVRSVPVVFLTVLTPSNTIAVQSMQILASTHRGLELERSGMISSKPYRPQDLSCEIQKIFDETNPNGSGRGR